MQRLMPLDQIWAARIRPGWEREEAAGRTRPPANLAVAAPLLERLSSLFSAYRAQFLTGITRERRGGRGELTTADHGGREGTKATRRR